MTPCEVIWKKIIFIDPRRSQGLTNKEEVIYTAKRLKGGVSRTHDRKPKKKQSRAGESDLSDPSDNSDGSDCGFEIAIRNCIRRRYQ